VVHHRTSSVTVHLFAVCLAAGFVGLSVGLWPAATIAQRLGGSCAAEESRLEDFFACVVTLISNTWKETSSEQATRAEPLREHLTKLAQSPGYKGAVSHLDELKRLSIALKHDPASNRELILLLDNAIASHETELRPAMSTQRLADASDPSIDIYPAFVRQKLSFLGSAKARFYDRGPFEIAWRSLYASALESEYFIEQNVERRDKAKLWEAIRVLDEIHARRTGPEYAYLPRRNEAAINSELFWRASLLFALGEKAQAKEVLRSLALNNQPFTLKAPKQGHVYIYKIFNFAHQIVVQPSTGKDGIKAEIRDQHLTDRYYNPAQLAAYTCSHIDAVGIEGFAAVIKKFVLSDYYVIAASSNDPMKLRQLEVAINKTLDSKALAEKRSVVQKLLANEMPGFSDFMKHGAKACNLPDSVRDEIYSPFELRPYIKNIQEFRQGASEFLLFGGRMNARQADALSEFLNNSLFQAPDVLALRDQLDLKTPAYAARMRIEQ